MEGGPIVPSYKEVVLQHALYNWFGWFTDNLNSEDTRHADLDLSLSLKILF